MNNAIRLLAAALLLLWLIAGACQRQAIAAGAPVGIASCSCRDLPDRNASRV
jgi:hypothetical protein